MSEYTPKEWVKDNMVTNAKLRRLKELIEQIPIGGTIDDALSNDSENAVQNKVITNALNDKQKKEVKYTFSRAVGNPEELVCDQQITVKDVYDAYQTTNVKFYINDLNVELSVGFAEHDLEDDSYVVGASAYAWLNDKHTGLTAVGLKDSNVTDLWFLNEATLATEDYVDTAIANAITSAINANY